ncbi:hypothetical protein C8R44DRAFT_795919 [Mycena epipterygia]|nr:hypothetical protein C8R44DRAFT_795919 [Mycena epipterygia]
MNTPLRWKSMSARENAATFSGCQLKKRRDSVANLSILVHSSSRWEPCSAQCRQGMTSSNRSQAARQISPPHASR